jgi:hypothetical protein
MSLSYKAERAYGPDFVPKARTVSAMLGVPLDWLLAAICWETAQFKCKGPPWPINAGDGGGGLIGFTPLRTHPAALHNPVEQLDDVQSYFRRLMSYFSVASFQSPEDMYMIIRAPAAIGKADSFPVGGKYPGTKRPMVKGDVNKIYGDFLQREGVSSPLGSSQAATGAETAAADAEEGGAAKSPAGRPFVNRIGLAKTTGSEVRVRSGPGLKNSVVRVLMARGSDIHVLGQVRGDNVNGNDLWHKTIDGYVSDTLVSFQ